MSLVLVILAAFAVTASGLPALLLRRNPRLAQRATTAVLGCGALVGLVGAAFALVEPAVFSMTRWGQPGGSLSLRLDSLSAFFLIPVLAVPSLGSIYGLRYWPQEERGNRSIRLQLYFGLVTGAMTIVCLADNAILFLAAWEVMALCGFLLVNTEHERPDVQRAAFVYLAAAHVGNLALFALFGILGRLAGSFEFSAMVGLNANSAAAAWVFGLALFGFGLKAGLVPLHFWLPGAHATAPSHVSVLMSGVLLKIGIYGILRVTGFFDAPPAAWGGWLVVLGVVSGVLGVAFALAQHDLKRLLAYHSVENIGIIALGIGLALLGRSLGDPMLVVLGFAGAVLHVVNHATFKSLLFFGAGAVDHATGTREIDRLGGLIRRMPWTAALFLTGSAAIVGLPPLNGFASEWLVYLASFRSFGAHAGSLATLAVLGAPALALIGGLAAACFAKVVGTVFLGHPRTESGSAAHEVPATMLFPMIVLAAACAVIGLAPVVWVSPLARAASVWSGMGFADLRGPVARVTDAAWRISFVAGILAIVALALMLWRRSRLGHEALSAPTWSCGFLGSTPRMQYTGSSFAALLVERFRWAFFPTVRITPPAGLFPRHAEFDSHVPDTVLDVALLPALVSIRRRADGLRARFGGRVQSKVVLVLVGVLTLLAWVWWRR